MADIIRTFVCGDPIKHSRSPLIHNHWLARYNLKGGYEAVHITPANLGSFLKALKEENWAGGNFTIPHKEAVFQQLVNADDAARAIGAANTVWFESGELYCANTDAYGFAANLDAQTPDWRGAQTAMIFGAGGAARAILFALLGAGVNRITLVNRTIERAEKLADDFGKNIDAINWHDAANRVQAADILINTTSLGMNGQPDFPLDLGSARNDAIASDIVYVPLQTPFLSMAADRGLKISDGLGMLLHQAAPGFEKWYGLRPQVDDTLRQLIIKDMAGAS